MTGLGLGTGQGGGSPGAIFQAIKDSLFSSQTLGGLVSVGASIGLDAIGAPPTLQSFVPGLLGQLVAGASGGTGGESGDNVVSDETGKNLFGRILDSAKNFGSSLLKGVQNVISFGTDVIAQGFEKTVDFFGSIFGRQTQEVLYEASVAGSTGLGSGWQKIGSFTDENGLKTVFYENAKGDTMRVEGVLGVDKLTITKSIGGKISSEIFEGLGRTSAGLVGYTAAQITENVGENLQARYIASDGVFKQVDYIDINAQQILSRVQAGSNSKGLEFEQKGSLFNGIFENFLTGTAYAYDAGRLISSSIVRKDSSGVFSISSIFDPITNQIKTVYDKTAQGLTTLYKTQIDLYDRYLDATSEMAKALREFLNEVYNLEGPQTKTYNSSTTPTLAPGVVVMDVKLDWYRFLETKSLADLDNFAADLIIPDAANRRWRQAVVDAVPKLVDQMRNQDNKVIITTGVNSGLKVSEGDLGYTPEQMNALAASFAADGKRVMIAHSAGTEMQLKAILEAKKQGITLPDKFVFFSPRVSREQFKWYLDQADIRADQVLVVTAAGDFPHYPSDIITGGARLAGFIGDPKAGLTTSMAMFYDYENNRDEQGNLFYNYAFLKTDLTYESDRINNTEYLGHGGMLGGAIEGHRYTIVFNGSEIEDESLQTFYIDFTEDE